MKIVLASKSPRRKEILENLGLDFEIMNANCNETTNLKNPSDVVKELATRKGLAVKKEFNVSDETLIISCDTIVYAKNSILGKPKDKQDEIRMLKLLSGTSHEVMSALCLIYKGNTFVNFETTKVYFKDLSEKEIKAYSDSSEPYDKAGGYAVQGFASLFIEKIEGNYFNVVGFPVNLFYKMLKSIELQNILLK